MSRKLLGGTIVVATLASTLAACSHMPMHQAHFTQAQLAAADAGVPSRVATRAKPTVPEMAPTGDLAPAVDPNKPGVQSAGTVPVLAPTGIQREPYVQKKR
jgi:hypothetical protein